MNRFKPRHFFYAFPLLLLMLVALLLLLLVAKGRNLKSQSAQVRIGMPRDEVVQLLGPPVLVLQRTANRGEALCWTNQFWQIDVLTGPDGQVETVGCIPSDSFYRRTVGSLLGRGHTHPHQPVPP